MLAREWKVPKISKLLRRLPTSRAITCTRFEVKRSKVKVTRPINAETEVCHLRTSNLLGSWSMRYQLSWPAIKACEVGLLYRVGRTRNVGNVFNKNGWLGFVYSGNSTDVLENVSGAEMSNSTVLLQTTSRSPARHTVTPKIVATVGLIVCIIGACANALVLAVLIRARWHFGNCVHSLIANQSAMDLFACVFAIATLVMMLTHGFKYNGNEILDGTICVIFEAGTLTALGMMKRLLHFDMTIITTMIFYNIICLIFECITFTALGLSVKKSLVW